MPNITIANVVFNVVDSRKRGLSLLFVFDKYINIKKMATPITNIAKIAIITLLFILFFA
jgi:hypothetical protein